MKKILGGFLTIILLSSNQIFARDPIYTRNPEILSSNQVIPKQSVATRSFNGCYSGLALGGSFKTGFGQSSITFVDTFTNGDSDEYDESQMFDLTRTTLYGGAFLGYGCVASNLYYLGFEASYNFSSYKKTTPILSTDEAIVSAGSTPIETNISASIQTNLNTVEFAIDFRPGVLLTTDTMLYGRVGITHNKFSIASRISYSFTNPDLDEDGALVVTQIHKKRMFPFRFGIGLERRFANYYSLRVDYVYTPYNQVLLAGNLASVIPGTSATTYQNLSNAKISSNTLSLGLSYYW